MASLVLLKGFMTRLADRRLSCVMVEGELVVCGG